MIRRYKDYEFACLNKKNFIISQLITFVSTTVFYTVSVFLLTVLIVCVVYPFIMNNIVR